VATAKRAANTATVSSRARIVLCRRCVSTLDF